MKVYSKHEFDFDHLISITSKEFVSELNTRCESEFGFNIAFEETGDFVTVYIAQVGLVFYGHFIKRDGIFGFYHIPKHALEKLIFVRDSFVY